MKKGWRGGAKPRAWPQTGQWERGAGRELAPWVLAWATQPVVPSDPRRGSIGHGHRRTPGWWHPARDTFSAQVPCQAQPEEPVGPTLAWRHRAPGGPPSSPATRRPALTSPRHRVSPASICCLLPPSPSACLFFFQNHRLPRRQSSKGGGVLETSLCPPKPIMPHSRGGDGVGGSGPGRQAASSAAGVSSALAPGSAGGILAVCESSPHLRVSWKGALDGPLLVLALLPALPCPPSPPLRQDLVRAPAGVGSRLGCRALPGGPEPWACSEQRHVQHAPFPLPRPWPHPFFSFPTFI